MKLNVLPLQTALYYLHVLQDECQKFSAININSISINIYGSIVKDVNREYILQDLKQRLNDLLSDSSRDEFTFGITATDFPNIKPEFHGKKIYYKISRNNNEIVLEAAEIER